MYRLSQTGAGRQLFSHGSPVSAAAFTTAIETAGSGESDRGVCPDHQAHTHSTNPDDRSDLRLALLEHKPRK